MKKLALSAAVCAMAFSANADVAEEVVVETAQGSIFSGIYGGLGIGGSFLKCDDLKANRFIGSFVLGGGKVLNNGMYIGAEVLSDFTKTKKWDRGGGDNVQTNGFIPQIDAKIGYAFRNNSLVYAKFGCAWSKISSYNKSEDKTHSKTKASFVTGLGAEKAFCKKFSTALEGDYNFGWKEDGKRFNKGWTVRALVKYNVKY